MVAVSSNDEIRGVLCGGGLGTRVWPASKVANKHLLPLGVSVPMVVFPLLTLEKAGIRNACVISGPEHSGDFNLFLGDGKVHYPLTAQDKEQGTIEPYEKMIDLSLMTKVQAEPGGIAQAVLLAEDFVDGRPFVVILGDNVLIGDINQHIEEFRKNPDKGRILVKEVNNPQHYGIAVFDENWHLRNIIEKPEKPPTNLAVIGVYMYPPDVFEIIKDLRPSARGELEITDVNRALLEQGRLECDKFEGIWADAGEHQWSLFEVGISLAKNWDRVIELYPSLRDIEPPPEEVLATLAP